MVGVKRELITQIRKRQFGFLGHTYTERKRAGKRLLIGNAGGKESNGKTETEIYGWNQRTNWMWKDGRGGEIC